MVVELPDLVHLLQPDQTGMCGQTCVAMVAGVSLREATRAVGVSTMRMTGTTTKQVVAGLTKLGIRVGRTTRYSARLRHLEHLPERAILSVVDNKTMWGHWVVLWDGFIYDPGIDWPMPFHVYENIVVERAFSRRYKRPRDGSKRVKALWDDVIPILGKI